MSTAAGLAYREAGPADGPVALLLHDYRQSSYMWRHLLPELAAAGRRPAGGGARPRRLRRFRVRPARHLGAPRRERGRFPARAPNRALRTGRARLGGLIGLWWACEHADAVDALVISSTGFFRDGKCHGMARALREPGTGEQLLEAADRDTIAAVLRQSSSGIDEDALDEYWKAYSDPERRRGHLELYRSGDFAKLERFEGGLRR